MAHSYQEYFATIQKNKLKLYKCLGGVFHEVLMSEKSIMHKKHVSNMIWLWCLLAGLLIMDRDFKTQGSRGSSEGLYKIDMNSCISYVYTECPVTRVGNSHWPPSCTVHPGQPWGSVALLPLFNPRSLLKISKCMFRYSFYRKLPPTPFDIL